MKIKNIVLVVLILGIIIGYFNSTVALAQNSELQGDEALKNGDPREAFDQYMKTLQQAPEGCSCEKNLEEKIISVVAKLSPKPTIPEESIMFEGRAEAALKSAKTEEDFLSAAKEYRKALRLAPWNPTLYYNLGVVYEKAQRPQDAVGSLKMYLMAQPAATDVIVVKKKIAGLEYDMEKAKKDKQEQQQQEQNDFDTGVRLAGNWQEKPVQVQGTGNIMYGFRMTIETTGTEATTGTHLTATVFEVPSLKDATNYQFFYKKQTLPYFDLYIKNNQFTGTFTWLTPSNTLGYYEVQCTNPVTSVEISDEFETITLNYQTPQGESAKQVLVRMH